MLLRKGPSKHCSWYIERVRDREKGDTDSHNCEQPRKVMRHRAGSSLAGCSALRAVLFLLIAYLHVSLGGVEAAPSASHNHKRAAEDLWNELTEGIGKAENHDHWERIVRRSARDWYDPYYSDDALHIVNVQAYYRQVLEEEEWSYDTQPEQELARLMNPFYDGGRARVQDGDSVEAGDVQKRIPGRYIVMLDSSADGYTLDRTIAILQHAHTESEGRIRADHITPMRSIGIGFTATMNSKTVELVREMACTCLCRWPRVGRSSDRVLCIMSSISL